ncbi:MAG: 50S ribosomal protein L20 [Planctomycetota bacterium]
MPRARNGAARRQSKKRVFAQAKGNRGGRRNHWRSVQETVIRAGVNAYRDRRLIKRDYRQLWIVRINAACRARGISYSRFINGLKHAGIGLNRKMLSEIAIHDEPTFDALVEAAKNASPAVKNAA